MFYIKAFLFVISLIIATHYGYTWTLYIIISTAYSEVSLENWPRTYQFINIFSDYYPTDFFAKMAKYIKNDINQTQRLIIDYLTGEALGPEGRAVVRFILESLFSPYNLRRIYSYHRTLSILLEAIRP